MVVSVRRACCSLKYCFTCDDLYSTCRLGSHAIGDDARPIAKGGRRRGAGEAEREEQAHAIGPSQIEILADDGFEEVAALHGPIEDLGQTDFELADREAMVVAGRAFGRRSSATAAAATSGQRRPGRRRVRAHRRRPAARRGRRRRETHCRGSQSECDRDGGAA